MVSERYAEQLEVRSVDETGKAVVVVDLDAQQLFDAVMAAMHLNPGRELLIRRVRLVSQHQIYNSPDGETAAQS